MSQGIISDLIKRFEIENLEKHFVYSFIQAHQLEFKNNTLISTFFEDFELDTELWLIVSSLDFKDLKTLEHHLELLIPTNDRKVNGAFFTPNYIVDFIIKEVNPQYESKCLDPSCGCGAFLIGLIEYYQKNHKKSVKETVRINIFGSDILDYNIRRAKILIALYGLQQNEIIEEEDFNLYHQDSLKASWKDKFEIIVGNPPYVKYQDLSDENRKYLISNWQTIEAGTFNLYFAFFELGYNLLESNGRLGYITPNNYFTSLSGLTLRQYFTRKKCLTRILDFRHKKVFDAQTYTAITFANKQENPSILFDKITDEQTCENFLRSANGSPNEIKNLNIKKWRLLKKSEQENIRIIESIGTPIKQLFNIAVGIATLKDDVFFVDSANQDGDLLTKTTENGTFLIEKAITKPVYKISQFKNQADIENNTLRIITPYNTSSKSASPIPESEFKKEYPHCYEYLLSEKLRLESRDKGKSVYDPFYSWGRTQGITRFGKKILNPTFSKHPRFLYVPEEDAYYTNGYGIYFNKSDSSNQLFDDLVHPMSKEENIMEVQKILNSKVMDYYITLTSVSIQGGFPCYQKNFIEKFTIPPFSSEELNLLRSMSNKDEIDEFLIDKYGLMIQLPNLVE